MWGCSFDAGITTIQSHPYIEHLLAVGRSVILLLQYCHSYSLNVVTILLSVYSICENLSYHYRKPTLAVEPGESNGIPLHQGKAISSLRVCTTGSRFYDSTDLRRKPPARRIYHRAVQAALSSTLINMNHWLTVWIGLLLPPRMIRKQR